MGKLAHRPAVRRAAHRLRLRGFKERVNIRDDLDELETVVPPHVGEFSIFLRMANLADEAHFGNPNQYQIHTATGIVFEPPTDRQMAFYRRILVLFADLETIVTLVHRARWTAAQYPTLLTADECVAYLQADIHAFHAEMRSLFDSIALTTKQIFYQPNKIRGLKEPPDTFFYLRKWCHNFQNRALIGSALGGLISNCDWFDPFRQFRESIIHKERDAFVQTHPDGDIIFRMLYSLKTRMTYAGPAEFLWKDWIRFDPYAGYYLGKLLFFLDRYCEFSAAELEVDLHGALIYTPTRIQAAYACIGRTTQVISESLHTRRVYDRNWDAISWTR
jgi:hypothetical protein